MEKGIQPLLLTAFFLALADYFLKPVLKAAALPLRMVTFGLFNLVINMGIIWLAASLLPSFSVEGVVPLLLTAVVIFGAMSLFN
jgi:putative membrane protein